MKRERGARPLLPSLSTREFQRKKRRGDDENTSVDLKLLKPISDTAFYGPEHEQKAKLALIYIQQKAERERRRKRADEATWHMFRKQKEAFDHADRVRLARLGEEGDGGTQSIIEPWDPSLPQVFAVECAKGGIRKYIAATYEDFWAKYCMMQRIERIHYEVIREGRPCRLYFDLEFDKSLNRDLDGNRLVETLKRLVKEELMREHQITLNDDGILDLDSSTEDKFSRHLICHMGAVFLDNRHMGAFVKRLVGNIRDKKQTDETVAELFVNTSHKSKDDGERREIFIDEGVYTRNRCFRMLFSTKLMKKRFLRLSEMNSFRIRPGKSIAGSEELFYSSLITHISATTNSLLDGGKVHDAADQPLPTAKPMIQARDENASSGNSSSSSSRCSLPASTTTTMTTTTKTDDKAAPKPVRQRQTRGTFNENEGGGGSDFPRESSVYAMHSSSSSSSSSSSNSCSNNIKNSNTTRSSSSSSSSSSNTQQHQHQSIQLRVQGRCLRVAVLTCKDPSPSYYNRNKGPVHWREEEIVVPGKSRSRSNHTLVSTSSSATLAAADSKYPLVDQYVLSEATKFRSSAYLKSKHVMVSENAGNEKTMIDGKKVTICYGIGGSRYCSNIGREHKSNGIYFVATLPDGIVYQKCHDPDCRNFRSAPLKVIPRYAMDADLDSADLDAAVSLEEEVRDLS